MSSSDGNTYLKGWVSTRSLLTSLGLLPKELKAKDTKPLIDAQNMDHTSVSQVKNMGEKLPFSIVRPREPEVTYLEIFRFAIWSIMLIITQTWRDFTEGRRFRPSLSSHSATHYFVSFSPSSFPPQALY